MANDALNRMEVDTYGLDEMDRKLLLTIIEKFSGGPVGLGGDRNKIPSEALRATEGEV